MKKRHVDYSKIIIACILTVMVSVLFFCCYMVWDTKDSESLVALIGFVSGGITLVVGLYLWRAKAKDKLEMYRNDPEAFKASGIGNNDDEEAGG